MGSSYLWCWWCLWCNGCRFRRPCWGACTTGFHCIVLFLVLFFATTIICWDGLDSSVWHVIFSIIATVHRWVLCCLTTCRSYSSTTICHQSWYWVARNWTFVEWILGDFYGHHCSSVSYLCWLFRLMSLLLVYFLVVCLFWFCVLRAERMLAWLGWLVWEAGGWFKSLLSSCSSLLSLVWNFFTHCRFYVCSIHYIYTVRHKLKTMNIRFIVVGTWFITRVG